MLVLKTTLSLIMTGLSDNWMKLMRDLYKFKPIIQQTTPRTTHSFRHNNNYEKYTRKTKTRIYQRTGIYHHLIVYGGGIELNKMGKMGTNKHIASS